MRIYEDIGLELEYGIGSLMAFHPKGSGLHSFPSVGKPAGIVVVETPWAEREFLRRYPRSSTKLVREFKGLGDISVGGYIIGALFVLYWVFLVARMVTMSEAEFKYIKRFIK